ncbi:DUF4269 domain-containing protein [Adhaeribacter sp. BT258]|uniref:DUF4269 domain-containing protein n=1 Tax=Adhaeribacter terrigena TaxID=2793070 RepID=A0ABS1C801_9BACT|nr:DUF4269 domain-containing protein [Adhaeribacter terrigena]MBK0404793.1 DUF4269 domain-containing protein [Adhaeribacter terrigena]
MDFTTIENLKKGTPKQQEAYRVLTQYSIMEYLQPYSPILAGTIPIDIDIEKSDLDIICYWENVDQFKVDLFEYFSAYKDFQLVDKMVQDQRTVIANFIVENFEIEIFGQNKPSKEQYAYKHMVVEHYLLLSKGNQFRQTIRKLKVQGFKTEPAFAHALGLKGDPYLELLQYEEKLKPCLLTKDKNH